MWWLPNGCLIRVLWAPSWHFLKSNITPGKGRPNVTELLPPNQEVLLSTALRSLRRHDGNFVSFHSTRSWYDHVTGDSVWRSWTEQGASDCYNCELSSSSAFIDNWVIGLFLANGAAVALAFKTTGKDYSINITTI